MTKSELVKEVAERAGISKTNVEKVLKAFTEVIQDALSKGDKVAIVGFGSFGTVERASREVRNPRTGEKMTIPSRKVIRFVPGKELKEAAK